MISWIKNILKRWNSPETSEADAKLYLNELRQNELSISASFRRGEIVTSGPGQVWAPNTTWPKILPSKPVEPSKNVSHINEDETDFATSLVVAAITDSALIGYAAGRSIPGALIGELISTNESQNSTSETSQAEHAKDDPIE